MRDEPNHEMVCDWQLRTVCMPTTVIATADHDSPVVSTLIYLDATLCGIVTLSAAKHSVHVARMQQ